MKLYKILLSIFILACFQSVVLAQLPKDTKTEKITTTKFVDLYDLYKTDVEGVELYSLSLPNNSKYYEPVILYLGTYRELISNLKNLSTTMCAGEDRDIFYFKCDDYKYKLVHHSVAGEYCFKVYKEHSSHRDYGILYKYVIDRILEYFDEEL